MIWEAHKVYIRDTLINIGSRLKKERAKQIVDFLKKICTLDGTHKKSLAKNTLAELTVLQNQLCSLAMDTAKAMLAKCRRSFYEHSNKCGKLLAHALRAQQTYTFVPELIDETQQKVHATEEIADIFQKYCISLYNFPCHESDTKDSNRVTAIQAYLQNSGLPRLLDEDLTSLEEPISSLL